MTTFARKGLLELARWCVELLCPIREALDNPRRTLIEIAAISGRSVRPRLGSNTPAAIGSAIAL